MAGVRTRLPRLDDLHVALKSRQPGPSEQQEEKRAARSGSQHSRLRAAVKYEPLMFLLLARLPVSADKAGGKKTTLFSFSQRSLVRQEMMEGRHFLLAAVELLQKNENKNISLGFRLQHPSCKRMHAVNLKTRGS